MQKNHGKLGWFFFSVIMFTNKNKSLLKPHLNSCAQAGKIIHFSLFFFSSRWIWLDEQNKHRLRGGFYC